MKDHDDRQVMGVTTPPPRPRRRWGRRIGLSLLLLVVSLVVAHWWWGRTVERALAAQLDGYRRAGDPVSLEDLTRPPIPDGRNAAVDLTAAAASVDGSSPLWKAYGELDDSPRLPLTDRELTLFRALVEQDAAALNRVSAATRKPAVNWGTRYQTPMIDMRVPHLNEQRELANLLHVGALIAHHDGRDGEAVERVRELLFVSRAVGHEPTFVAYLVAFGISSLACDVAVQIAPELKVGSGSGAASPQQVRDVLEDLLDERSLREAFQRGFAGERVSQLDSARPLLGGRFGGNNPAGPKGGLKLYLLRPVFMNDIRVSMEHTTTLRQKSAELPDWPAFAQAVPALPAVVERQPRRHILSSILLPSLYRGPLAQYRAIAARRLAATALAVRFYAIDHDGRLPAKLQDLVPSYLPAVPHDPLAAGSPPLGYVPDAGRPVVYSVGENGIDNGGREVRSWRPRSEYRKWADEVRHLKRQPRPQPPEADELPPDVAIPPEVRELLKKKRVGPGLPR